ncbi:MAG TPA: DUF5684 domain-containing protein [Gemmatimonadales bacterium]|nr:DUF5684 domain-containing protein [Gemmatimonadales bacterium]
MQDTFPTSTEGPGPVFWIVVCALIVVQIAAMWKVFEKAGQPGWAAIIPIYNLIVLIQIAGKPVWWILLYLIPVVSIIVVVIVMHNISKNFGKGLGTTLGLIFLSPIFFPILAWGDAQYQPPVREYQPA